MVAILLAGGVLLGFGTLAVDVGVIYTERQQLQSGADAAALGLANACSRGHADCDPANGTAQLALAAGLANANMDDGAAEVFYVCGKDSRRWLNECDGHEPDNLTRCVGNRPAGNFVEVHVRTLAADGGTFLPPVFAQTLVGAPNMGTTVGACARASWSTDSVVRTAAFAISICAYAASKTETAIVEPRAGRHQNDFRTLNTHDARTAPKVEFENLCTGSPPTVGEWRDPPDFAWVATVGSDCEAAIVGRTVRDNGISDWPTACRNRIHDLQPATNPLTTITIPVIDGMRTTEGGDTEYHVGYYVSLTITGYFYDDTRKARSWALTDSGAPSEPFPCGEVRCISTTYFNKVQRDHPGGTTSVISDIRLTG